MLGRYDKSFKFFSSSRIFTRRGPPQSKIMELPLGYFWGSRMVQKSFCGLYIYTDNFCFKTIFLMCLLHTMGGSRIFDWGGPRIDEARDAGQKVAIFALDLD